MAVGDEVGSGLRWTPGFVTPSVQPYAHRVPNMGGIVPFHPAETGLPANMLRAVFRDLRAKDPDVYHHGHRVAVYAMVLGEKMGLSQARLGFLGAAAWLHDLGKLHIPKEIRFKEGRLTPAQYEEMKKHVRIGARLLRSMGSEGFARVALQHHEWHTGWGYPFGLDASKLSVEVQITSVADAYDAMTIGRCYRDALAHSSAMAEITRYSGIQFNPVVVQALLAVSDRIESLRGLFVSGCSTVSDFDCVQMIAAG